MYAVVADIERYPEFLPMCTGLTVTSREPDGNGETLIAKMSVGYKQIAETFTTRVQLRPADLEIDAQYLDGPFKRLDNRWRFQPADSGGAIVDFYISYEFKSAMLGLLVGGVFDQAFRKFTEAFEMRAGHIYGAPQQTV